MKNKCFLLILLVAVLLSSCATNMGGEELPSTLPAQTADLSDMDFSFSNRDLDGNFNEDEVLNPENQSSTVTIENEGVFEFAGDSVDHIVVAAGDQDKVQIVLNGAKIQNANGPAIQIQSADKVFITAKEGTENIISDGKSYSVISDGSAVDAAIFSKADLTINGQGSLSVSGNYKHGIVSKDDLILAIKKLDVNAKNVGINGKDCVKISDSIISLQSGSDGIRSDNTEDPSRGFVYVTGGDLNLNCNNDGIQAETVVKLDGTDLKVLSGGGSGKMLSNGAESYKGVKAGSDVQISGGTLQIDSRDDCLHSNHTITVSDGILSLCSGDDGIHADTDLSISGGEVTITKSYEALEATRILISGGKLDLTASDDGINAAGGADSSGFGARPGMGRFDSENGYIEISGGYLVINASGDGIDANGSVAVSGGVTLLSGPTTNGNGAFDFDLSASVSGGVVVALGSTGMAKGFSQANGQASALIGFDAQKPNETFALCDANGNVLVSFCPPKSYSSALVTCPEMQEGKQYRIVVGARFDGADEFGFVRNSAAEGGTVISTFDLTSNLFQSGVKGNMGGGPMWGGGKKPGNKSK